MAKSINLAEGANGNPKVENEAIQKRNKKLTEGLL